MKKILLILALLPTLIFADAVIFSGNDVKALKQNLDLFGVVKVMSGAVDPSAGAGVAAPPGSAYLSTVHGLFLKTGVANTAWTKNSLLPVDLTSQVAGVLPVANGGTGSATQNFVDLTTNQTIGGVKIFSSTISGSINGNAATVTTNANLTGDVTSVGNTTSYNNVVPVNKGGTGSATQNFVDLTTAQNIAGNKTFLNDVNINGTTSLSSSLTGFLKATSGVVSALSAVDLTTDVTGVLPIANGGTGSSTQNFVDLSTTQSSIGGSKGFTSPIGVGAAASATSGINLNPTLSGGNSQYGLLQNTVFGSGTTTAATGIWSRINTAAASFTLTDAFAFDIVNASKGAGSTITNLTGLMVRDQTQGTENYGIQNAVTSGANKWGYYGSGSANNAFAGNTRFGGTTAPTAEVDVTGNAIVSGSLNSSLISALNMLPNGDVELNSVSMFTCGSGNTCSRTTTTGEFSQNLAALKVATSAATLNVSQTVNTTSGIQKKGFMRIIYRIPSAVTDAQICTMVDSAEQTCVPSAKLINNGLYQSIEVPLVFGSTSVGWKAKTTATNTQSFFFDGMVVGQGLGLQNLQLDYIYTANITTTSGAVSKENKDFIASCTAANPTVCTFNAGYFTTAPVCVVAPIASSVWSRIDSVSSTGLTLNSQNTSSTPVATVPYEVLCVKTGVDYANASANVYSQASADYGATSATYTLTNAGNATVTGKVARDGERAIFSGRIVMGSSLPTGTITLNLPSGYVMDGSSIFKDASIAGTPSNTNQSGLAFAASSSAINFYGPTASSPWNATTPATWVNGNYIDFTIESKIVGWSTAPAIVGSFAGVPAVPGYQGLVDTFSVSYGTTNATTACSASPCSYLDQIGTAVSSITRASTGYYSMITSKTYSKLKCTFSASAPDWLFLSGGQLSCNNCSSVNFFTSVESTTAGTETPADSYGIIMCQGAY